MLDGNADSAVALARARLDDRVLDHGVADAALRGLLATRKTLPPKLFYDAEGCRLFGEITRLPEYYPTRTELALLRDIADAAVSGLPSGGALVEYGASDEVKARLLLDTGDLFTAYVPIDVAEGALDALTKRLRRSHPALRVHPVVADFLAPFALPDAVRAQPLTGFFPGSTIGNLDPDSAHRFLVTARRVLGQDARFLVGVDLQKDTGLLIPAYDDAQGVTAAFNLNLLRRLNREAAADFDLDGFAHRADWNSDAARIEMHLVSQRAQTVHVAGHRIRFGAGETIHTENSYKHTLTGFQDFSRAAGWHPERSWTDPAQLFSVHLLTARQPPIAK